ncbi:MAG: IS66 family transposase [Nanoarchaeota archaeon]|mgnify:CR=1 FL=1
MELKEVCDKCRPLFEIFLKEIENLKKRLSVYENAHTPPSRQRRYPKKEKSNNKIGAPKGHPGTTREKKEPTERINVEAVQCSYCYDLLDKPFKQEKKIIEEIPDPQPIRIIEFLINHYKCPTCNKITIAKHKNLPQEGNLGNNLQAQIALMKYEDRLPHRKIVQTLNRQYPLGLTPSTILEVTNRVAKKVEPEYNKIKQVIRNSPNVYSDETGHKVQGKKFWLWGIAIRVAVIFAIRKRRCKEVLEELLGEKYNGIISCDGWSTYYCYSKNLQRCWAHLLREAEYLAEQHGSAQLFFKELKEIYFAVDKVTEEDSLQTRKELYEKCILQMERLAGRMDAYTELRKFAVKIRNGGNYFFTRILHTFVESTNNRAERALREPIVQRKIIGTLRNEKGIRITEVLLSVFMTWRMQGLNTYDELRRALSS